MRDVICCGITDTGKRKNNQDSYVWMKAETAKGISVFAVVCDGMGGINKGERASGEAVRAFGNWYKQIFPNLLQSEAFKETLFKEWDALIRKLNTQFILEGKRDGAPMGTTAVLLLLFDGNYYLANVGDSRVYAITGQEAVCLTKDHSRVMQYYEQGKITFEEIETHPERNVLLKCIGDDEDADPDFDAGECFSDTVFLLCSDGFRHKIPIEELAENLKPYRQENAEEMKRHLSEIINTVYERGERDNATAVALKVV